MACSCSCRAHSLLKHVPLQALHVGLASSHCHRGAVSNTRYLTASALFKTLCWCLSLLQLFKVTHVALCNLVPSIISSFVPTLIQSQSYTPTLWNILVCSSPYIAVSLFFTFAQGCKPVSLMSSSLFSVASAVPSAPVLATSAKPAWISLPSD